MKHLKTFELHSSTYKSAASKYSDQAGLKKLLLKSDKTYTDLMNMYRKR